MARVAEYLNLPSVPSKIAHLVNNKELFRIEMKKLGIPGPRFQIVTRRDLSVLREIIDYVGYPLIVKNSSSSGSRGTKIFYSDNFKGVYSMVEEAIEVSRSKKALIESLWEGSEHTVETIFDVNGIFHRCFITDRLFDKSKGFALETGLVHPSKLTNDEQNQMYILAQKISNAIGIKIGAAKFDMMQTKEGPRIIEMTVRLSGGFDCQYLVPSATGKNVIKAAILTALGENFSNKLLKDTKHRVALSESIWPPPGKITKIDGVDKAEEINGFEFMHFRYDIGDIVESYTDCTKRVCHIIASGDDYAEAKENIACIKNVINIKVQ
jgi:carbamoylphosphate synthase large subunit